MCAQPINATLQRGAAAALAAGLAQLLNATARDIARRSTDHPFAQHDLAWQAADSITARLDEIEAQNPAALRGCLEQTGTAAESLIAAVDAALRAPAHFDQET